jgi:autotransporter-associated beta strand protein
MRTHTIKTIFLLASLLTAGRPSVLLAQTYWTGNAGVGLTNWGNALNWSPNAVPDTTNQVVFDDVNSTSYSGTQNATNNAVDASFTSASIRSLQYLATGNNHYYGTLIPANTTLTLSGSNPEVTLGAGYFANPVNSPSLVDFFSIAGPGALSVANPLGTIDIHQINGVTLNLSNLTNFNANVSNLWVGVTTHTNLSALRSPLGTLMLARTNNITTAANPAVPGILLGRGETGDNVNYFGGQGWGRIQLGVVNTFQTDGLVVGGARAEPTLNGSNLKFTPGTTNNSFTLRGSAGGSTPAAVFSMGDGSATETGYNGLPFSTQGVPGDVDFSGGTVDILANTIIIGRTSFDGPTPGTDRNSATGTLLFEQGTIDATNVNIGYFQYAVAVSSAQGTLTARSNAVLNVRNNLTLAYVTGTNGLSSTPTAGTLNVNDNALVNVGGNIVDGGGRTVINLAGGAINMQPSWSAAPGNVTVKNLSGWGAITNAGTISINGTNVIGFLTNGSTLFLGGNLIMDTNTVVYLNVGTNNTVGPAGGSDYVWVGGTNAQFKNPRMYLTLAGPLTPSAVYRLIDCTNALSVGGTVNAESPRFAPVSVTSTGVVMVVNADTNVATVYWNGSLGNIWDTSLVNTNWNYQGNQDAYHQLDNVVFDDSCVNPVIWPGGQLSPSSVLFNGNTKDMAMTNKTGVTPTGSINGSTGITKTGTNTLIFGTVNTFTGPVNISNGVFRVFDPTFSTPGGALVLGASNGPVTVASGATLDIAGTTTTSPFKTNYISGNGFNGMGVITNSATSAAAPAQRWYFRLLGDSTFALNSSGLTIQNPAQTATYGGWLDLNNNTLTKSGASVLVFQQCSVTNPGSINLAGGELRLNHTLLGGAGALNLSNATIFSCASGNTITSLVTKATINIPANAVIAAPNTLAGATPTFTIGSLVNLAGSLTVSNFMTVQMTNAISGAGTLTKGGNSNLVLFAANTYTGPTTINAGRITLAAGSTLASTNITVNNSGILDVSSNATYTLASGQVLNVSAATASVFGNLTVPSGATLLSGGTNNGNISVNSGTLSAGPLATVGTLRGSNLTLNAASVVMNLGGNTNAGGVDNDLILCNNLTLSGVSTITISPVGALVTAPNNPYTLIRYTGTPTGNAANLNVVSSNPRYTFAVIDPLTTPGSIQIQISSIGSTVDYWQGLAPSNPSAWDNGTTFNWLNGGNSSTFFNGDTAVFDNTGLTNGVDLVGTVQPAAIIVSNNATAYTLRGSGRLQAGTMSVDSTSVGGVIFANASSNTFNGAGITLNPGTTLTLTQAPNTFLTSALIGTGTVVKAAANILTVIGNSDGTFFGTNLVSAGTLRPGGGGALGGTNAAIVVSGGTLDLNGQVVSPNIYATGAGTGAGAIDNTGGVLMTNRAVASLTLTGPTTFGATSNRWDIGRWIPDPSYGAQQPPWMSVGNYFNAQSNSVTKIGTNDVWLDAGGETYMADINIGAGRFVVSNPTWSNNVPPTLGYNQNTITVSNGGTLGLDGGFPFQFQSGGHNWGVNGDLKPAHLLSGSTLQSLSGSNYLGGPITLETNVQMRSDESSGCLTLAGNVQGPGNLVVVGGGPVRLSGVNTYSTNTIVAGGTLMPAAATALPANSLVVLSNSPSTLVLADSVVMGSDATLQMVSTASGVGSGPTLSGDGTWSGPVIMNGSHGFVFNGSVNGLNVAGPINSTNASGTVTVDFDSITFATALQFQGTFLVDYHSALSAGTLHRPILNFEGQNSWTNMIVNRGRLNIRTNNALPPLVSISAGTLLAGVDDRTLIFDLGGYNQTLSSVSAPFGFISTFLIGNSSGTANSILTYAGTGANSWSAVISDGDPETGPTGTTLGLAVTSGTLTLSSPCTYTGPTTISGGILYPASLGNTPVTVSSSGTLAGAGTISGPVTNAAGGTISPGVAIIGTLTISNDLTLSGGSFCHLDVNLGTSANDEIAGIGTLTYGGTLILNNVGTAPYTNGTIIKLFDAQTYIAGSVTIQPASPGAGLLWDTSYLATDGTLRVIGAPAMGTPSRGPDGNVGFTITGTLGQAYSVRASTNVALPIASWTVLESGTLPSVPYLYTDITSTNYLRRFYRVSTP